MGIYSDYLNSGVAGDFEKLTKERKRQLRRISGLRGRDVLVIAADMGKQVPGLTTAITFEDRLPISDQLSNLHGAAPDLILETPGGLGDGAEEIVRQIRDKYSSLGGDHTGLGQERRHDHGDGGRRDSHGSHVGAGGD